MKIFNFYTAYRENPTTGQVSRKISKTPIEYVPSAYHNGGIGEEKITIKVDEEVILEAISTLSFSEGVEAYEVVIEPRPSVLSWDSPWKFERFAEMQTCIYAKTKRGDHLLSGTNIWLDQKVLWGWSGDMSVLLSFWVTPNGLEMNIGEQPPILGHEVGVNY